jgi:hypothetical protein
VDDPCSAAAASTRQSVACERLLLVASRHSSFRGLVILRLCRMSRSSYAYLHRIYMNIYTYTAYTCTPYIYMYTIYAYTCTYTRTPHIHVHCTNHAPCPSCICSFALHVFVLLPFMYLLVCLSPILSHSPALSLLFSSHRYLLSSPCPLVLAISSLSFYALLSSPLLSSPLLSSPLLSSPLLSSPLLSSPLLSSPLLSSPLLSSPLLSCPLLSSPLLSSPLFSSPVLSSPVLSSPLLSLPAQEVGCVSRRDAERGTRHCKMRV